MLGVEHRLLLRGTQPVIAYPARSIDGMRIPSEWRQPLEDGRLLVLSSRSPLRGIVPMSTHLVAGHAAPLNLTIDPGPSRTG